MLFIRKKRLIPLAILVFISLYTPANAFNDVDSDNQFYESISSFEKINIIKGYEDGIFKPESKITRAEFLKIVVELKYKIESLTNEDYRNCFPDVGTEWYANIVCYSKETELIRGDSDGNFYPNQEINLAEASKILYQTFFNDRILDEHNPDENWYVPFINYLNEQNIIPGELIASQKLTRAEAVEMFWRTLHQNGVATAESYKIHNVSFVDEYGRNYLLNIYSDFDYLYYELFEENKLIEFKQFSCGAEQFELIDNYTAKTDYSIFLFFPENYGGKGVKWNPVAELNPIDFDTFKRLNIAYSKDINTVFFYDEKIVEADPETFESVDDRDYAKDKNYVYYYGKIILGADPQTFQIFTNYWYSKDSDNIFDHNGIIIAEADVETFEAFHSGYAKDKNNLYYAGISVDLNGLPLDMETLDFAPLRDKNGCYKVESFILYEKECE
jgi:hypothetical protein